MHHRLPAPHLLLLFIVLLLTLLPAVPLPRATAHEAPAPPPPPVRLHAVAGDALADRSLTAAAAAQLGDTSRLWLVQFRGPIRQAWRTAAERAGARLYHSIPDYAYLARMDGTTAAAVARQPAVQRIGLYAPAWRLDPALQAARGAVPVLLALLPDAALARARYTITAVGGSVEATRPQRHAAYIAATVPAAALPELAALPDVVWINRQAEPHPSGEVARAVLGVPPVWERYGLYGAGQVIGISEPGLDTGDFATLHPDIRGRVRKAYALGRPDSGDWSDRDIGTLAGHGTHVVGTVLGNGSASGAVPPPYGARDTLTASFAGVAPAAEVVLQSIGDNEGKLSGIPTDYGDLMRQAYADGARIHTNAWGGKTGNASNPYGGYTIESEQVDAAAWELHDMLILFPTGNAGVDADGDGVIDRDRLEQPGTAKNVLTVGASETNRPTVPRFYTGYNGMLFGVPFFGESMTNRIDGMAAFSSRGPTDDGRIKPDVVAPGTYIIGTRTGTYGGWDTLARVGIVPPGDPRDAAYVLLGGSSMATSLTAGTALLARQWLVEERGIAQPSGALQKALLINGAADMAPGQYGTDEFREIPPERPNPVNGWGRLDLAASIAPALPRQTWLHDERHGAQTGDTQQYTIRVGDARLPAPRPLRVTLAWTDYPGTAAAARTLVNDLDLLVTAPDGQQYRGNDGALSAACIRDQLWDGCNPVEGVLLDDAPPGTYTIEVRAANVPQGGRQPYALVATGDYVLTGGGAVFLPLVAR